jgi:hypothetical protein
MGDMFILKIQWEMGKAAPDPEPLEGNLAASSRRDL